MKEEFLVGDLRLRPGLNEIVGDDGVTRVSPKAMAVLVRLAAHPGELVTKMALLDDVWEGRFVSDEVLTNAVYELRKALGDQARNARFIQTVHGKGYSLIASVAPVDDTDAPPRAIEAPLRNARATREGWLVRAFVLMSIILGSAVIINSVFVWIEEKKEVAREMARVGTRERAVWDLMRKADRERRSRHFEETERLIQAAFVIDDQDPLVLSRRAHLFENKILTDRALSDIEAALAEAKRRGADATFVRELELRRARVSGDLGEAGRILDDCLDVFKGDCFCLHQMAWQLQVHNRSCDGALARWESLASSCAEYLSENPILDAHWAEALFSCGRDQEAGAKLEVLAQAERPRPVAFDLWAWFAIEQGEVGAAVAALGQLDDMSRPPGRSYLRRYLRWGELEIARGRLDLAHNWYERFSNEQLYPIEEANVEFRQGLLALMQGRWDAARSKAVDLQEKGGNWSLLGDVVGGLAAVGDGEVHAVDEHIAALTKRFASAGTRLNEEFLRLLQAESFAAKEQFEDAVVQIDLALAIGPLDRRFFREARACYRSNNRFFPR